MIDFGALVTNPHVWVQWPHVFAAGLCTAAFFVLGIVRLAAARARIATRSSSASRSRWRRWRQSSVSLLVILVGHSQAQHMVQTQPMKMAAAEALWNTESQAAMSLFTIGDTKNRKDVFSIRIPSVLSILAYNQPACAVQGINDLQAAVRAAIRAGQLRPDRRS